MKLFTPFKTYSLSPFFYALFFLFILFNTSTVSAQIIIGFQGGETGDPWGYSSTGASALSISEATQSPNKVTGTTSLVVGGNTAGGNCFAGGSGNGPNTPRTFTFNSLDISSSNASTRTLTFNWGNRFPSCNGTGWDSGENLVFTAYHNGVAQTPVTLATGVNNAQFSILSNSYTWSVPPCVSQFYFVVSVTTNRADELLFIDNVKLTTPQLNGSLIVSPISGNTPVCVGSVENYSITPETGISYTWSGLPAGASFTTTNGTTGSTSMTVNWGTAAPGNYTLTVTPTNSCGNTGAPQTLSVTILSAPAPVTISGPTSLCSGQTITLTSGSSSGNNWSTGETTVSISVTTAGTYTLSNTNICGTEATSHTVTLNTSIPASITSNGPTDFCTGGSVILTSNNSSGNNWSTGETTQSITVASAGNYTLSVTDVCGTTTASQQVTILPAPNPLISGNTSFCTGQQTTLTASGGDTYLWSNGATSTSITLNAPGTYTVTATNSCGQATSAPLTISENPLPTPQISGPTSFCTGQQITLTASGGDTYLWSTGATSTSITVNTQGNYTVTATNSCGQATSIPAVINENPLPNPQISGSTSYCTGQQTSIMASGGDSYLWSNGATTASIVITTPGTYTVTATNSCGQATSVPVTITESPLPIPQVSGTTSFCSGQQTTLTASGGDDYLWSNGATSPSITITTGGNYTLTAFNGCGQTTSSIINVVENPLPNPQITGMASFCAGQQTMLTASGGTSYLWSNGSTSTSIPVSTPGSYTVTAFNSCGQTMSTPINVTEMQLPNPQISGITFFCAGQQTQLTATGGNSYSWSDGQTGSSIIVTTAGVYTVSATNNCGTNTASTTITVSSVSASFTVDQTTGTPPLPVNFSNTSSTNAVSFEWNFGDGTTGTAFSPSHVYEETGVFTATLIVTNSEGCSDSYSLSIEVIYSPSSISIPNVFTPNGDHINDQFLVKTERIEDYQLQILNRWGNVILTINNPELGWDGNIQGDQAAEGTYFYQLTATGSDKKSYNETGFFELQR